MRLISITLLFASFLFISCDGGNSDSGEGQNPAPAAESTTLDGFSVYDIAGTSVQRAEKKAEQGGNVIEQGDMTNGKRQGTWSTFYRDDLRVKSVTNYVDGKKHGIHIELNDRGQITLQCSYTNDILDGRWTKFRFGSRKEKEALYKMGKIDGFYREYHKNGKLMKAVEYTDGQMDGSFKQYNDEEKLVMEYVYKDGEKVSGGMVTE